MGGEIVMFAIIAITIWGIYSLAAVTHWIVAPAVIVLIIGLGYLLQSAEKKDREKQS